MHPARWAQLGDKGRVSRVFAGPTDGRCASSFRPVTAIRAPRRRLLTTGVGASTWRRAATNLGRDLGGPTESTPLRVALTEASRTWVIADTEIRPADQSGRLAGRDRHTLSAAAGVRLRIGLDFRVQLGLLNSARHPPRSFRQAFQAPTCWC